MPLFSTGATQKRLTILTHSPIYAPIPEHIHGGDNYAMRLAQGHPDTQLGEAGDQTSNLPVTSHAVLPPEPHAAPMKPETWCYSDLFCVWFLAQTLSLLPPEVLPLQSNCAGSKVTH